MSASEALAISTEARPAWLALCSLLDEMAEDGRQPVCALDAYLWSSPDPTERAEAAAACRHCPVLTACAEFATANRERHGVWGGTDRTLIARKRAA